jgi:crotonobetainyl-CoA:carnitine CoA-transferase CaiB-like acyl-CoA transferase
MGTVGPLVGIRILEVGHVLAGPYATMVLADLGAEVTKVEPPGGDISRQVSDSYLAGLNRNKRSVRVDLATEAGQERLHQLAAGAHALLTNLRPPTIRDRMLSAIEADKITGEMAVAPIALALANHPALESYDLSSLRFIMWGRRR